MKNTNIKKIKALSFNDSNDVIESLYKKYLFKPEPESTGFDFKGLLNDKLIGKGCIVSSFGVESAVALHYCLNLNPNLKVVFIDTKRHFQETHEYKDQLKEILQFDLITVSPDDFDLNKEDKNNNLFRKNPDACCEIRKNLPLREALKNFDFWVSGRKRYQSSFRSTLSIMERDNRLLKINPMAMWSEVEVKDYRLLHNLPNHPLYKKNYLSIGCECCTRPVKDGEDARAGRWDHIPKKTECGIHFSKSGKIVRNKIEKD